MWLLVIGIVVVLIIGYNIGFSIRDWQHKKWLAKTEFICPKCKQDTIKEAIALGDFINMFKHVCENENCGYFWTSECDWMVK